VKEIAGYHSRILGGLQDFRQFWDTVVVDLDCQQAGNSWRKLARQGSVSGSYLEEDVIRSWLNPPDDSVYNSSIS
jgi:hypothetical protein